MKTFLLVSVLLAAGTFGAIQALNDDGDQAAGVTSTTVIAGLPPVEAVEPAPDGPVAPAAAPVRQRASAPAPAPARPAPAPAAAPAPAPTTTVVQRTTTTRAQPTTSTTTAPVEQPVCTITLSNTNPSAGEIVTATIASNQPNKGWHARINPNGSNSRGEGGTTDGNGATHFSWAVQAWDNGQVRAEVGLAKYGHSPEGSFARCEASYTVR